MNKEKRKEYNRKYHHKCKKDYCKCGKIKNGRSKTCRECYLGNKNRGLNRLFNRFNKTNNKFASEQQNEVVK